MSNKIVKSQVESFAAALQSAGTQQRAEHEKAYLKSELDFYGTPVPVIRQTAKAFSKEHPDLTHGELVALVEALWQTQYHEMRSLGIALLDFYPHLITENDVDFLEGLLRQMKTWAHVDWIATGAIASLVEREPTMRAVLARWSKDDCFWVRRTALLALMKLARTDRESFEFFAQFATLMLEEREFFIRKAIGWVLREVSKYQPSWVYDFLETHLHQVSGVTLREGSKYLPKSQREILLSQYKNSRN